MSSWPSPAGAEFSIASAPSRIKAGPFETRVARRGRAPYPPRAQPMTSSAVTRIEVAVRPELSDARGAGVSATIRSFLGIDVGRVRTRDVYRITGELSAGEAEKVRAEFTCPVLQVSALGKLEGEHFDVAITVGFKPGVTDPVGKSAQVAVEDTLGRKLPDRAAVYCLDALPARRSRSRPGGAHRARAAGQPGDPDHAHRDLRRVERSAPGPLRAAWSRATTPRPSPSSTWRDRRRAEALSRERLLGALVGGDAGDP